jgi:uncharacterized protein YjbI with pentapeptide repeats
MKRIGVLAISMLPIAVVAGSPEDMKTLKNTQICEICDFAGSDLRWANVYAAELGGAPNLVGAVMNGSNFVGANFYGANLEAAQFVGADLTDADLRWTSLLGTNFTDANMSGARFDGAIFCHTIMPDGSVNDENCQ